MRQHRAFALSGFMIALLVIAAVVALFGVFLLIGRGRAHEAARRTGCMGNHRHIGLALIQYAEDHDGNFPPLVDASGREVPAVDDTTGVSSLPARSAFVVLLKEGYLTSPRVFTCRSSGERLKPDWYSPKDYRSCTLAELVAGLGAENCSYGWDPTKSRRADATCAILADKPPRGVSKGGDGSPEHNSPNHGGEGQNVFYNDGHAKWSTTPQPDGGDDPDIYTGAPGYEKSTTDAKIIR